MIECGSGLGEARVLSFIIFLTTTRYTGMAQGQRAGLITPRSLDRNGLPVFNSSIHFQNIMHHRIIFSDIN